MMGCWRVRLSGGISLAIGNASGVFLLAQALLQIMRDVFSHRRTNELTDAPSLDIPKPPLAALE